MLSGDPISVCVKAHVSLFISLFVWFTLYLRMATVRASGEVAHGQMTSGFKPWDWNTFRKASHEDTDPEGKQRMKTLTKVGESSLNSQHNILKWPCIVTVYYMSYSHGLAPSATISMRIEDKLMSFCSLWAIMAQWRSRHFTKATRAVRG